MNHVPGPRLVQGKTIKSDYDRQRYTVARVDNPKFTEEANEASRRLIAAAPDLLNVLGYVANEFNSSQYRGSWLHDQVLAAIAKATGANHV